MVVIVLQAFTRRRGPASTVAPEAAPELVAHRPHLTPSLEPEHREKM
jgi:hypothetical protein